MNVFRLLLITAGIALLLHRVLLPLTRRRWKADSSPAAIAKAGTVAGLEFLRNASLCGVVASVLALVGIGMIGALGLVEPDDFASAAKMVGGIHAALSAISEKLSLVIVVLLLAGLYYLARRNARRTMSEVYQAAVERELQRLQGDLQSDRWEDLEPTPEMEKVIAEMAKVQTILNDETVAAPVRDQAAAYGRELESAWLAMDVRRRLKLQWDDFLEAPAQSTPRGKVLNVLFSRGTFDTAGTLSRTLARVAMVFLFLSLIGLNLPPVRAAAERRWVKLSELALKKDKDAALASAATLPTREADELDREIADALGSEFEGDFVRMPVFRVSQHVTQAVHNLRDMRVRRAILNEFAPTGPGPGGAGPGGLGQHPSMSSAPDVSALERDALSLYESSPQRERGPRTGVGQRFSRDLLEDASIRRTPGWEKMRTEARVRGAGFSEWLRGRKAAFGQSPTVHDLSFDLAGKLFGDVMNDVLPSSGGYGELLKGARGQVSEATVQQLYRMAYDQYVGDLARGMDPAQARVVDEALRLRFATAETEARVQRVVRRLPTAQTVLPKLADSRPRLHWREPGMDTRAAVSAVRDAPGSIRVEQRLALADQLASYEDFFPGQAAALRQTPRSQARAELLGNLRGSTGAGLEGRMLTRAAAETGDDVARLLANMASNASAVSGYFRVGGVVIGQDPGGTPNLAYRNLAWRMHGQLVDLSLVDASGRSQDLGSFDRAMVHQALGYAADDRRVAATMVSAGQGMPLKILLHPALVDTRLGNDVIELDRFVDAMARDPFSGSLVADDIEDAQARVQGHHLLYQLAWATRLLASGQVPDEDRQYLEEELASIHSSPEAVALAERALSDPVGLGDPKLSPLTAKREFYDQTLVSLVQRCRVWQGGLSGFENCVSTTAGNVAESWFVPPPSFEVWSGVRERGYEPDPALSFLRPQSSMEQFRFLIQAAFTSPPEFAGLTETERLAFSDPRPWEFPSVQRMIEEEIRRQLRSDPERAAVLRRVSDFVVLQRLFRTVLSGGFGSEFPKERLIELTRDTRQEGVPPVRTPRWNAPAGVLEQEVSSFMDQLLALPELDETVGAMRPALIRCSRLLQERAGRLAAISVADWAAACDFSEFVDQARVACSPPNPNPFACGLLALDEISRSRQIQKALGGP